MLWVIYVLLCAFTYHTQSGSINECFIYNAGNFSDKKAKTVSSIHHTLDICLKTEDAAM